MSFVLDMKGFKAKAIEFPEPLRSLILSERDFLSVDDFVSKFATWEKVLVFAGDL